MEAVILVAIRLLVYLCVTMSIDYDEKEKESIFVVAEGVLYRSSLTILHGWLCYIACYGDSASVYYILGISTSY